MRYLVDDEDPKQPQPIEHPRKGDGAREASESFSWSEVRPRGGRPDRRSEDGGELHVRC